MKITELIESYKETRHSVEASVATDNVLKVNHAISVILKKYSNKEYNPSEALLALELIKNKMEQLFYSDHFAVMSEVLPRHATELQNDWIALDFELEKHINKIKNDHNIREDIETFKAADGQLSPMSNKKKTTKKDVARSKVEQLFRESK